MVPIMWQQYFALHQKHHTVKKNEHRGGTVSKRKKSHRACAASGSARMLLSATADALPRPVVPPTMMISRNLDLTCIQKNVTEKSWHEERCFVGCELDNIIWISCNSDRTATSGCDSVCQTCSVGSEVAHSHGVFAA